MNGVCSLALWPSLVEQCIIGIGNSLLDKMVFRAESGL